MPKIQFSVRTLLIVVFIVSVGVLVFPALFPRNTDITPDGYILKGTGNLPPASVYWFKNSDKELVCGLVYFGENRPSMMVSHRHCNVHLPSLETGRIFIPQDGRLYILPPSLELVGTDADLEKFIADVENSSNWSSQINGKIDENAWR